MQFGFESLLPPLVAIFFAILTRRVIIPLACGVMVGAYLLTTIDDSLAWWDAPRIFIVQMWLSMFDSTALPDDVRSATLDDWRSATTHLQALTFSLLLGAMVGVLERGGGMRALIGILSRKIKSRRGAQTMIAGSGLAIFFDDYANTLLLGGTMRSTADRYRLSREKLAYLVDSTAAPVAGLAVVSTWAAIEISYLGEGLSAGGVEERSAAFDMFIRSIPYRFYPWFALAMVFAISWSGRDFGPMRRVEQETLAGNGPAAEQTDPSDSTNHRWFWAAAVLPVLVCLAAVAVVLIITGIQTAGEELDAVSEGPLRTAGLILGNGDSYIALIVGGALGLVTAIVTTKLLSPKGWGELVRASLGGAKQMLPALGILWFAWALSGMTETDKLDTGGYLASILSDRLDPRLLPTVVFLTAGAIAFSTGTSWGTMGILTPLSIALALKLDPSGGPSGAIALSTCGAVLAGAIFGDHCSPISDTTVLSSRASDCDHVSHVRTQMPYAVIVAVICVAFGTLPSAMGVPPWVSLIAGVASVILVVRFIGKAPHETSRETS
ncbi:MAG: Na+/H+ antiporter NhaC family protein [Planctomycetota bacterium]